MLIYFTEKIKLYFILVYECQGCIQRGVIVKLLGRKIDYKSEITEVHILMPEVIVTCMLRH
jgi:hypothetical protein